MNHLFQEQTDWTEVRSYYHFNTSLEKLCEGKSSNSEINVQFIKGYHYLFFELKPKLALFMSYLISMEEYTYKHDGNKFRLSDRFIRSNFWFKDIDRSTIYSWLKKLSQKGYIQVYNTNLHERYIEINHEYNLQRLEQWKERDTSLGRTFIPVMV